MFAFHRKPIFLNAVVIVALLGGVATAVRADTIGFESDALFSGGAGFHSVDSSHAAFSPVAGGALLVYPGSAFAGAGDTTNVLAVGPNLLQIVFDVPVSSLSFNFGGALPAGANAVLTLFNQGQQVGLQSKPVSSGLQSISAGGAFTSATFQFDQAVSLFFIDNVHFETNRPPVANAGADQTAPVPHDGDATTHSAQVTLDGSGSSDPDPSDTLTYVWKENGAPVANGVNPTLPLEQGDHTITLVVLDNHGATSNTDDVIIHVTEEQNHPPTADAGADQAVTVSHDGDPSTKSASFTLQGGASDPDGDSLSQEWLEGATSLGSNPTQTLTRPVGKYTFTFKVTDSYGVSKTDDVVVNVLPEPNQAPVAKAGADQTVAASGTLVPVTLNGSASFDPDGATDPLTYAWSEGVTALGSSPNLTVKLAPGVHILTLTVTDPYGAASSNEVKVAVLYSWSGVLSPVNPDGSSVFNAGRTVPVMFQLTGASAGITNLAARLYYQEMGEGGAVGEVKAAESTSSATTGNLFGYDANSGCYLFNWSTAGLAPGKYRLLIDLGDGTARTVALTLRS